MQCGWLGHWPALAPRHLIWARLCVRVGFVCVHDPVCFEQVEVTATKGAADESRPPHPRTGHTEEACQALAKALVPNWQ